MQKSTEQADYTASARLFEDPVGVQGQAQAKALGTDNNWEPGRSSPLLLLLLSWGFCDMCAYTAGFCVLQTQVIWPWDALSICPVPELI